MKNLEFQVIGCQAIKCSGNINKSDIKRSDIPLPVDAVILAYVNGTTKVLCPHFKEEYENEKVPGTNRKKSTCGLHITDTSYLCPYKQVMSEI